MDECNCCGTVNTITPIVADEPAKERPSLRIKQIENGYIVTTQQGWPPKTFAFAGLEGVFRHMMDAFSD